MAPLSSPPQACEQDIQCRAGTCCAVSLWLRGLRVCTPLGRAGEECHPGSHKVLLKAQGTGPVFGLQSRNFSPPPYFGGGWGAVGS